MPPYCFFFLDESHQRKLFTSNHLDFEPNLFTHNSFKFEVARGGEVLRFSDVLKSMHHN